MTSQINVEQTVLVLAHTGRTAAVEAAEELIAALHKAGVRVVMLAAEAADLAAEVRAMVQVATPDESFATVSVAVVLGGDGTILRAAEVVRGNGVPLLGVNLGHVGFLAEAERDDLQVIAERIAVADFQVEERMALEVEVSLAGKSLATLWALNEASIEKADRHRMIELVLEVDDRPVTSFAGDGVVLATPTGSTAYAFSAGGPVVWPEVEALLIVPISAHALFARPLVVAPSSVPGVRLSSGNPAILWCDGRRSADLPPGARVEVRRSHSPVRFARLAVPPFTDRLVAKFELPVNGWRVAPSGGTGTRRV